MELQKLFDMQRTLDQFIQSQREVQTDVFQEKCLALLVELSELANETRCFKFWSQKGPSEGNVILEEYVDSIHFLLSLGIEKEYDGLSVWPSEPVTGELTELFLKTGRAIYRFIEEPTFEAYSRVWILYGAIAKSLGFSEEDVLRAYIEKNEENYKRQHNGY